MTAETPTIEPIPLAHMTSAPVIPREYQREFVVEMDTKGEVFRSEYRRVKLLIEMLEFRAEKNRSIYRDVPARLREAQQKKRTMKRMIIEALRKHEGDVRIGKAIPVHKEPVVLADLALATGQTQE